MVILPEDRHLVGGKHQAGEVLELDRLLEFHPGIERVTAGQLFERRGVIQRLFADLGGEVRQFAL